MTLLCLFYVLIMWCYLVSVQVIYITAEARRESALCLVDTLLLSSRHCPTLVQYYTVYSVSDDYTLSC